jgi:AraC-like DNA-binding protein
MQPARANLQTRLESRRRAALPAAVPKTLSAMSLLPGSPNSFPPQESPPGRVLAMSVAGCDGATVLDLVGPPSGELRHHHGPVCLQRWLSPLTVRPLQSDASWQVLRPQVRLWRPAEAQFFQWDGSVHQQFVLISSERIERILERPYAACGIDRWGGRDFDDRLVNQLITAMTMDCADGSPAGPLVVDSLVAALVHRLAFTSPPSLARQRLSPARVQRVLAFVDAEMHRPIGLDELAALAGVGVRQFCAAFRDAMGTSPHQYLLQCRVERAKQLLREPMLGLAEIAAAVGFSDQSQFTRTFSRMAGRSPGRYRGGLAAAH